MDQSNPNPISAAYPDSFFEKIRQSLDHLYELPFLLANSLDLPGSLQPLSGKSLRVELMRSIENLNPGPNFSLPSREARSYNLLTLRYIQKMGIEEIAAMLNVSVRQAYRDLRGGEEKLAALIWERHNQDTLPVEANGQSIGSEISRMPSNVQPVDLVSILQYACQLTRELANQRHIFVRMAPAPESPTLHADLAVIQQFIVSLISFAVRHACSGSIVEVQLNPNPPDLFIQFSGDPQLLLKPKLSELIIQLTERLNWSVQSSDASGLYTLRINLNQKQKTFLVVEDNEGVIELYRRYLTDQPVSIIPSTGSLDGLRLAGELLPDLILLDVMMQGLDGWEFLQRIKLDPRTAHIPVIICSVFNEPDLAKSLGAAGFLPKPVTQQNLFSILRQIAIL